MAINNNQLVPADFLNTFGIITRGAKSAEIRTRWGGHIVSAAYPNGYEASIVRFDGSYGFEKSLWEIAVCRDREIVYDTPVTDDVIGFADNETVVAVCKQIAALPAPRHT